jgi:hypothetical protein
MLASQTHSALEDNRSINWISNTGKGLIIFLNYLSGIKTKGLVNNGAVHPVQVYNGLLK